MAYTIERKTYSDALSDTYDVIDTDSNIHYNMTEYFLADIPNQTDAAAQKYLRAYRGLWALRNIGLTHLPKIISLDASNSVIIIWEKLYGLSFKEYADLYNARVSYRTVMNVLSPLLDDCETAHQNGLYFTISPETIFITDGGVLKLNTLINASANIYTTCMGVARSIFFMLTGFPYGNVQIPVGVYIPDPLWRLLYDVLTWRREFGGVSEFHTAIRTAIRDSEYEDGAMGPNPVLGRKTWSIGARAAAGLGMGCFTVMALTFVLLAAGIIKQPIRVSTAITSYSETPDTPAESDSPFLSPSFGYAYFNPQNASEIYNGMSLQTGAGLFYRRKCGQSSQLVKESGNGPQVMLNGVFPTFIQYGGGIVYFCDGYKDYIIRSFDGKTLKNVVNNTSGYLCLYENYLYYINDDDNGSIYRLNTQTDEITKVNDEACCDLTIVGKIMYYVNVFDSYAVYYINMEDGGLSGKPLQLAGGGGVYGYGLKSLKGSLLYCRDDDGQLSVIGPNRTETPFIYPVSEYAYDVYGDRLYYLDYENLFPHELLITGGGKDTVISAEACSYIAAADGGALFVSDKAGGALCRAGGGKREVVDIAGP